MTDVDLGSIVTEVKAEAQQSFDFTRKWESANNFFFSNNNNQKEHSKSRIVKYYFSPPKWVNWFSTKQKYFFSLISFNFYFLKKPVNPPGVGYKKVLPFSVTVFRGYSQHFWRSCAKFKSNISKRNFVFRVLHITSWQQCTHYFFKNHSSLVPKQKSLHPSPKATIIPQATIHSTLAPKQQSLPKQQFTPP